MRALRWNRLQSEMGKRQGSPVGRIHQRQLSNARTSRVPTITDGSSHPPFPLGILIYRVNAGP